MLLNFNQLYYFWVVCKSGSVSQAAQSLSLTSQAITSQIRALENRFNGKLFKRQGRGIEPTELGKIVFRYCEKMFSLSQEMLEIIDSHQEQYLSFNVGVADALSKPLVSQILQKTQQQNNRIKLRCFESTHELLLEQLAHHQIDMFLSDCPVDSAQQEGIYSIKLGESPLSFFALSPDLSKPFPYCLEDNPMLLPSAKTALGRKLQSWINLKGLHIQVLGEFDDAALMKAFALSQNAILVLPSICSNEREHLIEVGQTKEISESYYAIFVERVIQHPAVKAICTEDFTDLFYLE
ncbi:LysR family transcriptional regulator [Volucribacter psittacicida]|uniref:LysR family transcriptional regulator n=1 Tax=Volucribacter psittacicida TaxID=203482 RepID=A0A4R1FR38_9PAST|nr:transcriptional activator NhaR [Volucribacter psittacicida]TCJ94778.1 LysR family transcriptional regulator [Volucribacter psittacicida]